jgi:membrane protease YdiL (CAAX protease family)
MNSSAPTPALQHSGDSQPESTFATALRGFGPVGLAALVAIVFSGNLVLGNFVVPLSAALTMVWVVFSRTPWAELGFVAPESWAGTIGVGVALGVGLKFLMKALVMPLLGADPINHAYHGWAGNAAMLPFALWASLNAGFSEELVNRGFLFERSRKLIGNSTWARIATVILTSLLFGAAHYSVQGVAGAEQATIVALVLGGIFARIRRIYILMVAHAAFDLAAVAMIYWNLESVVAHLIFSRP